MNVTRPYWWLVNIGLGNGSVPSGNKPLPEPMLPLIYVVKWRNQASVINITFLYAYLYQIVR